MSRKMKQISPLESQRGAVLLTSLLILLILSLLAISSMQSTTMQERMVLAQKEGYQAMEGAELALREAENAIDGLASPANIGTLEGFYDTGTAPRGDNVFASGNWSSDTNSVAVSIPTEDGNPIYSESPRYMVEYIGDAQVAVGTESSDINMSGYTHETGASTAKAFRIVARGTGATGQSERILEEYYRREF
ncbi:PilX N-terminal domain-containing pilus assembly protein [Marinobacter sp. R17]|uniref:pilus assembly PilX family protein n=1 Tax=Marinobacter sp. R17 TaxID=2484250 RepID=UPI0016813C90|nr:pilus assembly protein [Marinobacter sp. R17]